MRTFSAGVKAFIEWATLPNVARVFDLTLKIAALVAVVAVASFFTGRGDLRTEASCLTEVKVPVYDDKGRTVLPRELGLTAEERAVPEAALRAERLLLVPLADAAGESLRVACNDELLAVENLRRKSMQSTADYLLGRGKAPLGTLTFRERDEREELLLDLYPDAVGGAFSTDLYAPQTAVFVAASAELDTDQIRRIVEYMEHFRSLEIRVDVTNVGSADALDVTIPSPEGFRLQDPPRGGGSQDEEVVYANDPAHDLAPGEKAVFIFEASGAALLGSTVELTDLVPTANTTPKVNVRRQLTVFSALLLFVVVPLVVRDVRSRPKEDA
jgi:hypothetical protein